MENSNENAIPKPRNQVSNTTAYAHNGKIMLCSGIILFTAAVTIIFCFHSYARSIYKRRRRRTTSTGACTSCVAAQGLDLSVIKTLPSLVYVSKTDDGDNPAAVECAVRLPEFQEGERGPMLPNRNHTFNACCFDIWFCSHSNCPLYRAPVQSDTVSGICEETVVPVFEVGLQPELRQKKEDEMGSWASSPPATFSPIGCQRKSADFMSIIVELPREDQRYGLGLEKVFHDLDSKLANKKILNNTH